MNLVRLTPDYDLTDFDCEDEHTRLMYFDMMEITE